MATATLKASLIEAICTKRIDTLNATLEERKAKWIDDRLAIKKTAGMLFWKRTYYPTLAEVKDDFEAWPEHGWGRSPRSWIERDINHELSPLQIIERVAREAQERGDGGITLDHDEVETIRKANFANGDAAKTELEAA